MYFFCIQIIFQFHKINKNSNLHMLGMKSKQENVNSLMSYKINPNSYS